MSLLGILIIVVFSLMGWRLLYMGRKRRIGDAPHCRKCNYLLHGLPSERCPECGSVLSSATIVHGEPTRRWRLFLLGWLTLLVLGIFILTSATEELQSVDWYQYKPTYFVLRDLNSGNLTDQLKAWTELMRRDADKPLSAGARDAMARFALARQLNATQPYTSLDTETVNYLGARCLLKDLPADQLKLFFDQLVKTKLVVRPTAIAGESLAYVASHEGLGPSTNSFWTKMSSQAISIDGRKTDGVSGGSASFGGFGTGSWGTSMKCPPAGKHVMSLTLRIEIFTGPMDMSGASKLQYQTDRTLTGNFEALAVKPVNFIRPIFDPKLAATVKASVTPTGFQYYRATHSLDGSIQFNSPPMNLAFDVIALYGGKEHSLNQITFHLPLSTSSYGVSGFVPDRPPAKIDLVLRPSEQAAADTVDINSYWNQEMMFPNIPVVQR